MQISSSLAYYSYSGWGNTARGVQTRNCPPSGYVTFNFFSKRNLSTSNAPLSNLTHSELSSLAIDDQKNDAHGESIVNSHSGHISDCDVLIIISRVYNLCSCGAPAATLICSIWTATILYSDHSSELTSTLCYSCNNEGDAHRLAICNISTHSLRSVGAMSLLLGNINPNNIHLTGWWISENILWYIHVTSKQLIHGYTFTMVLSG